MEESPSIEFKVLYSLITFGVECTGTAAGTNTGRCNLLVEWKSHRLIEFKVLYSLITFGVECTGTAAGANTGRCNLLVEWKSHRLIEFKVLYSLITFGVECTGTAAGANTGRCNLLVEWKSHRLIEFKVLYSLITFGVECTGTAAGANTECTGTAAGANTGRCNLLVEWKSHRLIEFKVLYSLITFGVECTGTAAGANTGRCNLLVEWKSHRLIEFKVLYSLITFGVECTGTPAGANTGAVGAAVLDPPENLFRIKLVCVLLETCGQYFSHGATRTKLDYFFVFFQTYFWSKVTHPLWKDRRDVASISIANYYREVLTALRPNIRLAKDYEEAVKASGKLLSKLPLGEITNTQNGGGGQGRMDMGVIVEEDGEEEGKENSIGIGRERKLNDGTEERLKIDDEDEDESEPLTEELSEELPMEEDEPDPQLEDEVDDDFLPEFEKMVSDNLQERTRETTLHKNKMANLSVPVNFGRSNLKQNYEQLTAGEPDENSINFMLMVRTKSNKQSYKPLVVPSTCDLVLNLKSQEKAKKDEMDQVKKLTLNITDRLEEEDYHQEVKERTAQSQSWVPS
ncbi:hypothetical protein WDU94_002549 [Cyamophila willieti]